MTDFLLDTADALVTAIDGGSWGSGAPTFTIERSFLPVIGLTEEVAGATILRVVPVSDSLSGKAAVQADVTVRLFVQQKLPALSDTYTAASEAATIAVLFAFTSAIQRWMLTNALSVDSVSAWCITAGRDPAHDMKLLSECREFLSSILATYRLIGI